jgi:hypothetical protein
LRRRSAAVDGGLHWRTSWAGGSQSTTGVTANAMRSDGLELDNTALSRDLSRADMLACWRMADDCEDDRTIASPVYPRCYWPVWTVSVAADWLVDQFARDAKGQAM